jgi:hypothetical protein
LTLAASAVYCLVPLNSIRFSFAARCLLAASFAAATLSQPAHAETDKPPIGPPGLQATYQLASAAGSRSNSIQRVTLCLGPVEATGGGSQWLALQATKANGQKFAVWLLTRAYPPRTLDQAARLSLRYLVQEGDEPPREFATRYTGAPVLPSLGAWEYLWPRPDQGDWSPDHAALPVNWLGHRYELQSTNPSVAFPEPRDSRKLELLPDVLVGVPSNTRTKDDRRRFDGSDYELIRLTRENYTEMIRAGLNCFRVDAEQAGWLRDEPVFCWGLGGNEVAFPECLYRSTYLGPALFLDEPAVGTRDYDIRPRLAKDPAFRRAITPQVVLEEFKRHYQKAIAEGAPAALIKGMQARGDVDLGAMNFPQRNLYSWETMVATAAWELTGDPSGVPQAIVFEPPGRLGSQRTLPEMNMAYGCQLSPQNPANLANVIFGFLRGAARAANKDWGVSIYGAVDRADAPWLLTHAYDLGATRFFFWDNYQLACVPYSEYLALARHLQAHAQGHPDRNLARFKLAAEAVILLPPGYDLGHTHMGRGNLWGLDELNLERKNRFGVSYRQVMGNFFTEIERCLRQGVAFDLCWDLPGLKLTGYREVVRVREDGRVEITAEGRHTERKGPRVPDRPSGKPPELTVELPAGSGVKGHSFNARARLTEGSAPVYYTHGADRHGVAQNILVMWELYGPGEEDYRTMGGRVVALHPNEGSGPVVEARFTVERPGRYRLRAAAADLAGRSTVVWKDFKVAD